ncbi:MAG TPA: hypothetical protein VJ850_07275, partial [Candidatus Limnocylindrales bacterium]|nr:hypothetical protein [Candidatus Limnocylindrales bacterium]
MAATDVTSARHVSVFWKRWPKARAKFDSEMARGNAGLAFSRVQREVGYLDKGMGWDISPGSTATNALVLRPRGDAKRRALARLWLDASPPPNASWEFGIGLPPRPVTETVEFTTIDGEHVLVEDILEYLHAEDDEEFL